MRLWHKDLIDVLPRQQLLGQWRECCCIAKNILINGTPNHILVNKILNYPASQFIVYAIAIRDEMERRGYKCDFKKFSKWWVNRNRDWELSEIFPDWHNDRYLRQCLYNLEEKAVCGGMSADEWNKIVLKYGDRFELM